MEVSTAQWKRERAHNSSRLGQGTRGSERLEFTFLVVMRKTDEVAMKLATTNVMVKCTRGIKDGPAFGESD